MKQSIIHGFLFGVSLTVSHLPLARADLPPPDGYVEQCTVEKQQAPGKTCIACQNDYRSLTTDAGDPCQQKYEPQGYTKICKSWGASVWTEVWCSGDLDAGNQVTNPVGSCSCRTHSQRGRGSMAALVLVCALVSTRLLKRRPGG